MSRIGRKEIAVPAGVAITVDDNNVVTVKGPKGTDPQKYHGCRRWQCRQGDPTG